MPVGGAAVADNVVSLTDVPATIIEAISVKPRDA